MQNRSVFSDPVKLHSTYQFRNREDLFFAGQMTGVEGYVESAASGLIAGINAARLANGEETVEFPTETAIGGMARYITTANPDNFQPMNANFGLFPELPVKIKGKQERNLQHANRALETIQNFVKVL